MSDWKDALSKIAPIAASVLGGPWAGIALEVVGQALNIEKPTVDKIESAFRSGNLNADQLVALKQAELAISLKLEELGVKKEELILADRADARAMQAQTKSRMPEILTVMVTIGFFGALAALFERPELKESGPVMFMVGQLAGAWASCLAFWVGTTSSSATKTNIIANHSVK